VRRWRDEGAIEEVLGRKLFVWRRRGDGDGPLLLFLHGFPSSSYDWRALFDLRPPDEATLAFDFLGFGLSEKPRDHTYTLA
jgi:pimeloyl-ACP methyl ester carboxylesterase